VTTATVTPSCVRIVVAVCRNFAYSPGGMGSSLPSRSLQRRSAAPSERSSATLSRGLTVPMTIEMPSFDTSRMYCATHAAPFVLPWGAVISTV
jgi:hypothetical protein